MTISEVYEDVLIELLNQEQLINQKLQSCSTLLSNEPYSFSSFFNLISEKQKIEAEAAFIQQQQLSNYFIIDENLGTQKEILDTSQETFGVAYLSLSPFEKKIYHHREMIYSLNQQVCELEESLIVIL